MTCSPTVPAGPLPAVGKGIVHRELREGHVKSCPVIQNVGFSLAPVCGEETQPFVGEDENRYGRETTDEARNEDGRETLDGRALSRARPIRDRHQ